MKHPYGIIKRQWGFNYIMTKKGIKRASADVGFIMVAYNLRRLMNIIGKIDFKKFLKELVFLFLKILAVPKLINSNTSNLFYNHSKTVYFKLVA